MVLEMLRRGKVARNSLGAAILGFDTADDDRLNLRKVSGKQSEVKEHDNPQTRVFSIHSMIPYEEFFRDRKFLNLEAEAKDVLGALLAKLHVEVELITSERGVLQPTEEIYVKSAKAFLESGKMKELAEFLLKAEHEDSPVSSDNSMMEKENMFVNKYKYRMLFLKYHKTAYKGKAPKVQSESQLRKRESGLTFKKWLGLS